MIAHECGLVSFASGIECLLLHRLYRPMQCALIVCGCLTSFLSDLMSTSGYRDTGILFTCET
ncbi:hypothetical protein SXCC_00120 [Gluconacetobacter sp. SXCC-1]|nr:hypothetical protein SXCC_00120 [Gluconacetobacter sp. SXCC-1]